jgi:hypothetical protein
VLQITIVPPKLFNEETYEIIEIKPRQLTLEHSLVSISKWESKYKKPFLTPEAKTVDETLYYIQCMTTTQNVDPIIYQFINSEQIQKVQDYIQDNKTATWFSENNTRKRNSEQITSELIYYWMVAFGIPMECQRWHLSRLLTLIRVCEEKNKPSKKRSTRDIMSRNASLNAARKKQWGTKG